MPAGKVTYTFQAPLAATTHIRVELKAGGHGVYGPPGETKPGFPRPNVRVATPVAIPGKPGQVKPELQSTVQNNTVRYKQPPPELTLLPLTGKVPLTALPPPGKIQSKPCPDTQPPIAGKESSGEPEAERETFSIEEEYDSAWPGLPQ